MASRKRVYATLDPTIIASIGKIGALAEAIKILGDNFEHLKDSFQDVRSEISAIHETTQSLKEDMKELKAKFEVGNLEELPDNKLNEEKIVPPLLCEKMADTDSCEQIQCSESSSDTVQKSIEPTLDDRLSSSLSSLTLKPPSHEKDVESVATILLDLQEKVVFIEVDPSIPTEAGSVEGQSVIETNQTVDNKLENVEQEMTPTSAVSQDAKSSSPNADGNDHKFACKIPVIVSNRCVSSQKLPEGTDVTEFKETEDSEQKTLDAPIRRFYLNSYDVYSSITYPLKLISNKRERIGSGILYDDVKEKLDFVERMGPEEKQKLKNKLDPDKPIIAGLRCLRDDGDTITK